MPPNLFWTTKLNDHLYVIAPSGPDMSNVGGNITVCIFDQGVLLVDANYFLDWRNGQEVPMAQSVVDEVKKITSQPIRWVINTHHHGDHAGGDPVFAKIAPIISHRNARDRILSGYQNAAKNAAAAVARAREDLDAARAAKDSARIAQAQDQLGRTQMNARMVALTDANRSLPTLTYETELTLSLSSEEVHLYHFGRAHTDGDTLVFFKTSNVIHWGDTFSNRWIPAMDASGNSFDWITWLDEGIAVSPTATMVPGHGAIGTQADVLKLRAFFSKLQSDVRQEIAVGRTREQAMDDLKDAEYVNYPGGAARLRTNIGIIYDQLESAR
jgi:glyoxylase-like metal-dependent hydrolase (beta-lactamase superfamily II)